MRPLIRQLATCAAALLAAGGAAHAQTVLWSRTYGGPSGAAAYLGNGYVIARSLAADSSGNVYATGSSKSGDHTDFLTTKIAANGAIAWQQSFAGPAGLDDDAMSIAVDARGDVAVVGTSYDASGNSAMRAIKYSGANGSVAWQVSLGGGSHDAAFFVATDAAGNAIVAGETDASGTTDIRVVKLAAASGSVLWDRTYDAGGDDFVGDLAVDAAGNAVVAGTSVNDAGGEDLVVIKLGAASGAQAWARTFDGGGDDQAFGLALDGSGNAIAVGASKGATFDLLAMKLAASNGAIVWRKTYDGGGDDLAQAVAVDHAGNAVVTGYGANAAGNRDFVTIKYGGGDGRVLWQKTFDGGADDWAYAVAMDGADNAYVAGTSVAGGNRNWMVKAYAAADGALLFSAPYASAGGEDDATQAIAAGGAIVVGGAVNESGSGAGVRVEALSAGAAAGSTNVALASAGGVASASSAWDASYPPSAAIDGDRAGRGYGAGGVWNDATRSAFPDWIQVQFAGPKTIDRVVVYSMQDRYDAPVEPSDALTASYYQVTDFVVQAWNGSAWTAVATVKGNNLAKRAVTFPAVTTDRIRIVVNNANGRYSRVAEIEAWTAGGGSTGGGATGAGDTNLALAGGTASASSSWDASYPPSAAIDGDRTGRGYGAGGVWNDATRSSFPDWIQVQLAATKTVDRVVVYSMQDDYAAPAEPTDATTARYYQLVDFDVQAWSGGAWMTVASVKGNDRAKRAVSFTPVSTDRVRIVVNDANGRFSRVAEIEVWGR